MKSSLSFLPYVLGVVLILIFVGVFLVVRGRRATVAGAGPAPGSTPMEFGPTQQVVASKRTYSWPDRLGYYVTFVDSRGTALELEVTAEWYQYLNPGARGLVSVQDGRFMGFQPVA